MPEPVHEHIAALPDLKIAHELIEEIGDDIVPMIEKGEHHDVSELEEGYGIYPKEFNDNYHFDDEEGFDEMDHDIPEKREHEEVDYNKLLKERDESHVVPMKSEHTEDIHYQPKKDWKADFHGHGEFEDLEEAADLPPTHHYEHSDGVDEFLEDAPKGLTPKTPAKDDPRLKIPKGKT